MEHLDLRNTGTARTSSHGYTTTRTLRFYFSLSSASKLLSFRPVKDTVVTNDRWGDDAVCAHGGFWTCDDRYTPSKWVNILKF